MVDCKARLTKEILDKFNYMVDFIRILLQLFISLYIGRALSILSIFFLIVCESFLTLMKVHQFLFYHASNQYLERLANTIIKKKF